MIGTIPPILSLPLHGTLTVPSDPALGRYNARGSVPSGVSYGNNGERLPFAGQRNFPGTEQQGRGKREDRSQVNQYRFRLGVRRVLVKCGRAIRA